jgi:L-fuculose-phosphate aldolase
VRAREAETGLRWTLASLCRSIVERGLVGPLASGNASIVADGGAVVAITAARVAFHEVEPGNVVILDAGAGPLPPPAQSRAPGPGHPAPSSELPLHLAVHRALPHATVVLHLHAPWMVAASCLAIERLPFVHYHQALLGERPTPVVPYATPGTDELAELVAAALAGDEADAAMLANHGGVVVATGPEEALDRAEALEDVCRLVVLTHGRARELEESELPRLRNLFRAYGR